MCLGGKPEVLPLPLGAEFSFLNAEVKKHEGAVPKFLLDRQRVIAETMGKASQTLKPGTAPASRPPTEAL